VGTLRPKRIWPASFGEPRGDPVTIFGVHLDSGHVTAIVTALTTFFHKWVKHWPAPKAPGKWWASVFDTAQDEFGDNSRIGQREPPADPR